MRSEIRSAVMDLGPLALIWLGTFAITFGGIPQLIDHGFTVGVSAIGQAPIGHSFSADDLNARKHYYYWAVPGFLIISIGMLIQAIKPIQTIRQGQRSI